MHTHTTTRSGTSDNKNKIELFTKISLSYTPHKFHDLIQNNDGILSKDSSRIHGIIHLCTQQYCQISTTMHPNITGFNDNITVNQSSENGFYSRVDDENAKFLRRKAKKKKIRIRMENIIFNVN